MGSVPNGYNNPPIEEQKPVKELTLGAGMLLHLAVGSLWEVILPQ